MTSAVKTHPMRGAKRILDLVLSAMILTLLSPFLFLAAILIRVDSRGPVFFRQERVGKNGVDFRIWKFRTMEMGAPDQGQGCVIEADDPRITRVGRFLRKWSIDEIPQFLNVIKGEMSLVGPRPTLRYQVEQYSLRQRKRLEVLPGISGWAQIHGRNEISWPERIEYDVWYAEHWSFWLDLRILFQTPFVFLRRGGLYGRKEDFAIRPGKDGDP